MIINENVKVFIMYITFLNIQLTYPAKKAQIILLPAKKNIILAKKYYSSQIFGFYKYIFKIISNKAF